MKEQENKLTETKDQNPLVDNIRKYFQRHYPFDKLLGGEESSEPRESFNSFKLPLSKQLVLTALKFSPWICALTFSMAFGVILMAEVFATSDAGIMGSIKSFYESNAELVTILKTLSISGLIGYGTNYIAIRMLFRPVEKRPIWGQGLIPSQKDRIIYTLAEGLHKHILSQELIRKRVEDSGLVRKLNELALDGTVSLIHDEELRTELKSWIRTSVTEFVAREDVREQIRAMVDDRLEQNLNKGMERFILQTYKRMNKEKYEEAISKIAEEIPSLAEQVIDKTEHQLDRFSAYVRMSKKNTQEQLMNLFVDLLDKIDITDLLAKQMAHFDEAKLEKMIWEATNEQLLYIQYLGTVLGILGGLIIWKPEYMGPLFALILGILFVADNLIYRSKQSSKKMSS
ncbi:MAG: DUF445 domain-containing protein [Bacteroidia bacterium]|nr:DUF445 domain-containing protein [Bacteroidia bacterium]